MKNIKKFISIVMLLSMIAMLLVGCEKEKTDEEVVSMEKPKITIGYVSWAECVATSNLWKVILDDLGYETELVQLDAAPLYIGLKKGDVDLFMDAWLPITHGNYMDKYGEDLTDCGIWYESPAKIGVVVPSYAKINSLVEFEKSKSEFENKIIGIDPGAGIMKATEKAKEDYKLSAEIVQGSETAMITSLKKAYENKKNIAITGWSPHWIFAEYELKYLEDPKKSYGNEEYLHILANKEFANTHKDIVEKLKNFKMNDEQIGSLEKLINEGMEPEEAAKKWIDDNKKTVNEWID